jgi:hypothetical protein
MSLVGVAAARPALIPFVVLSLLSGYLLHEVVHFATVHFIHYLLRNQLDPNLDLAFDGLTPNIQIDQPQSHGLGAIRAYGVSPLVIGILLMSAALSLKL